jgi:hypothetical protein
MDYSPAIKKNLISNKSTNLANIKVYENINYFVL